MHNLSLTSAARYAVRLHGPLRSQTHALRCAALSQPARTGPRSIPRGRTPPRAHTRAPACSPRPPASLGGAPLAPPSSPTLVGRPMHVVAARRPHGAPPPRRSCNRREAEGAQEAPRVGGPHDCCCVRALTLCASLHTQHPTVREIVTGSKNEEGGKAIGKKRKLAAAPAPTSKAAKPNPDARLMRMEDITQDLKVRSRYTRWLQDGTLARNTISCHAQLTPLRSFSPTTQPPQGKEAELFWPDDDTWYRCEMTSINTRNKTAKVLYTTGETEELSLVELLQDNHIALIV